MYLQNRFLARPSGNTVDMGRGIKQVEKSREF